MALQVVRLVAVLTLLGVAAAIATPRGRLPLALRGVAKFLDVGVRGGPCATVPLWKRLLAFSLVLSAALLALI